MTDGPVCITCGDVAVEMEVVGTDGEDGLAECVTDQGDVAAVDVVLLDGVQAGDRVLVHACVAIQRVGAVA